MIRKITACLVLASLVVMAGCDGSTSNETGGEAPASVFDSSDAVNELFGTITLRNTAPDIDAGSLAEVVRAFNNFSFDLHRVVAGITPAEGSIESGYSAAVALSLAYAGTAGSTQSGLAGLLGVDDIAEPVLHTGNNALALALNSRANDDLVLHTANRVFVRPGLPLQNEYLDIATADYGAPVTEADFAGDTEAVTRVVNQWVAEQTDDFIPSIIDRFSPQTVFALLNTIFLDAAWQDEYQAIEASEFTTLDGTTVSVESFGGRSQLPLLRSDDLLALEIPYGGGELAMLILMPSSIADLESTLDAGTIENVVAGMADSDVNFTVPNWEYEADLDLMELLTPVGLPASPWDFGRMIEGGAILDVLSKQKARIEVDKDGTRAAAVTVVVGLESVPESVSINRPFVYMIRDRVTGLILFTGRVVAPG